MTRSQSNVRKWFLSLPQERRLFAIEAYKAELATYTTQAHKERQEYLKECLNTMEGIVALS